MQCIKSLFLNRITDIFYRLYSFIYLILFKFAESCKFILSLHIFCILRPNLIQRCLIHQKYFLSFVSLQKINIRKLHIRSLICLVACIRLYNPLCPFVCPLVRWSVGPSISQSKNFLITVSHFKSFRVIFSQRKQNQISQK